MKKVQQITLGGVVFSIENDAYATLTVYLQDVEKHFTKTMGEDAKDVLQDIETGIAEKALARERGVKKAITEKDVDEIIQEMGSVEELSGSDEEIAESKNKKKTKKQTKGKRKLFRDTDDAVLGGVCSGLAKYFDIDVAIMRIIFLVVTFLHGFGLLAYIILWMAMPKAETQSEKMAMEGGKVNLKSIKESVKERIDDVPDNSWDKTKAFFNKYLFKRGKKISKEIRAKNNAPILVLLRKIIGIFIVVVTSVAIFAMIILLIFAYQGSTTVTMDPITAQYLGSIFSNGGIVSVASGYYIFIFIFIYIIIFVPLWFLLKLGTYLISKKPMSPIAGIVMILIFMISSLVVGAVTVRHESTINAYIDAVQKERGMNPDAHFYIHVFEDDENNRVLDLDWKGEDLIISDDSDRRIFKVGAPDGNYRSEKIIEVSKNNPAQQSGLKGKVDEYITAQKGHSFVHQAGWEKIIEEYLLSQKDFSWQTEDGSNHACVFENLENKDTLFPIALWVRCQEYKMVDGEPKELSGVSIPALLYYPNEVSTQDTNLFTHKIPRDGAMYTADIKAMFSREAQDKISAGYLADELKEKMEYKIIKDVQK